LYSGKALPKGFYERDPETVAKALLGKRLIRRLGKHFLEGVIVETEAYYGLNDPASRAYRGMKTYNQLMWREPGRIFIYNVHKYWMLNIVAHAPSRIGAVLLRAIEPRAGIEVMKRLRPVTNIVELANGPGKLTLALRIDKRVNGLSVTSSESTLTVVDNQMRPKIGSSHRIGVKRDLDRRLRFFIKGNTYVSR